VIASAGPAISPMPCAVAVIALTLSSFALTWPPNCAVWFSATGAAVATTLLGRVCLAASLEPAALLALPEPELLGALLAPAVVPAVALAPADAVVVGEPAAAVWCE
jgi:hypothetical protein